MNREIKGQETKDKYRNRRKKINSTKENTVKNQTLSSKGPKN